MDLELNQFSEVVRSNWSNFWLGDAFRYFIAQKITFGPPCHNICMNFGSENHAVS